MFIRYFILCSFFFLNLYSDFSSFTTNPTQITPFSDQANANVASCFNSKSNQIIFSWTDRTTSPYSPWYAIYDVPSGSFTTIPTQIDQSGYTNGVSQDVYCCYNNISNQIVFSWDDTSMSGNPWYAIYDVKSGSFTTEPTKIPNYVNGVYFNVFCCYNSISNQVVFSWADSSHTPWYAIYDVKNSSFSTVSTRIPNYSGEVANDVFCCYNSTSNQIVFSWDDTSTNGKPWYAIYDAKSGSFSKPPTYITNYSNGVSYDVFCCYNSTSNQVVFSWTDHSQSYPWYTIYDVKSDSFTTYPSQIPNYTNGVYDTVFCCYNSTSNQVVFSWDDTKSTHGSPWYAIYDVKSGNFCTSPTQINQTGYNSGVNAFVFCSYDSISNQIIFSWVSSPSYKPYYAIYTEPVPADVAQKRLLRAVNLYSPMKAQKGTISEEGIN